MVKCIPDKDNLQNLCFNRAGSRSRSPVVVKRLFCVLRVYFINHKLLEGNLWTLNQLLLTSLIWCAEPLPNMLFKAKVTSGVKCLSKVFPTPFKEFYETLVKCSPHWDNVQSIIMFQLYRLKVKGLFIKCVKSLIFGVEEVIYKGFIYYLQCYHL